MLLGKEPSKFEVYNDIEGELVNFFRVVKNRPAELLLELDLLPLNSREEFVSWLHFRSHYLGKRTADCAGFIKGYCWYNPETDSVSYATNGMPDLGANQMYQTATVKGPISTMPEIPGLAVWHQGHIGVYIGNGYAIEAMGTRYGVVKTRVAARSWTHWLKIPYINYIEETEEAG